MKGMMLTHFQELIKCILETRELMAIKTKRMRDANLSVTQRAKAGQEFLLLLDEYRDYVDELNEITETYVHRDFEQLAIELDAYLDLLLDQLILEAV